MLCRLKLSSHHPLPPPFLIPLVRPEMPLFIEMRHIVPLSPLPISHSPTRTSIRTDVLPKIRFLGPGSPLRLCFSSLGRMLAPAAAAVERRGRPAELRTASAEPARRPPASRGRGVVGSCSVMCRVASGGLRSDDIAVIRLPLRWRA